MAVKPVVGDKSLPRAEVERIKAPMELDLIAFFKQLNESVMDIVIDGASQGMTPDEIIAMVEELFNE